MERLISIGATGRDVAELQEALNASPPSTLPLLATDGVFGQKTDQRVREFQRHHGLTVDGVVGPQTRGRLYSNKPIGIWANRGTPPSTLQGRFLNNIAAVKEAAGVVMGARRVVPLQPVFLKAYEADIPTGWNWPVWLAVANEVWGKLGVVFIGRPPIIIVDPDPVTKAKNPEGTKSKKYYGDDNGETTMVRGLLSGFGVHVFVVDNLMKFTGGGDTMPWADEKAKVVISDHGSPGLLSHELGHVLGVDHPSDYQVNLDKKPQVMTPAGDAGGPHYRRNPMINYYRITWPPPSGSSVPLRPDP